MHSLTEAEIYERVIYLHARQELTNEDIAYILNISEQRVDFILEQEKFNLKEISKINENEN
jgi:DNA-binding CsgD family transcriptional regulator